MNDNSFDFLYQNVEKLKGIGPKKASYFKNLNINTVIDIFYNLPTRSINRTQDIDFKNLEKGIYNQVLSSHLSMINDSLSALVEDTLMLGDSLQFKIIDDKNSEFYSFNWKTPPPVDMSFNPNALQGGNYNVTVTDFNGCEFSSSFVINEPEELILDITTEDVLFCYGDASGNAEINISGGTPPYNVNTDNVIDLNAIPAGNYTFSVVDSNGCEVFENFEITQPLLLQITVFKDH